MSAIPQDLRYARSHEWLREASGGGFTLGITAFAQEQLGDIVFVELPQTGAHFEAGAECAVSAINKMGLAKAGRPVRNSANFIQQGRFKCQKVKARARW